MVQKIHPKGAPRVLPKPLSKKMRLEGVFRPYIKRSLTYSKMNYQLGARYSQQLPFASNPPKHC